MKLEPTDGRRSSQMSAMGSFFSVFCVFFFIPFDGGDRPARSGLCISPRRAPFFLCLHTQKQTGRDRVAPSSVLKGQRHTQTRTHASDVTARPRNSLTAQTGRESRYRSCSSWEVHLFICTFSFSPHSRLFLF